MLWPGGGRGGDLYHMVIGLLIFARADDGADQLFHGALLSTVNYLLIVISAEERSAMEQLSTSGSGGTVTAIIDTPRDGAPARRRRTEAVTKNKRQGSFEILSSKITFFEQQINICHEL